VNTALDAIGFLFGRNNYCRSFVTGMGLNPPLHPHDRRSMGDSIVDPWPGYLVGGGWPGAKNWVDIDTNYQTNEIAVNWQGGLIFALAGFYDAQLTSAKTPYPAKKAVSPARQTLRLVTPGSMNMTLPAGVTRVYDCTGRLLASLPSDRQRSLNIQTLGLGTGVFLIDSR